jgi:hypothetical protein
MSDQEDDQMHMFIYRVLFGICLSTTIAAASSAQVDRIWLVKDGQAAADVYAGATEWVAAEKLVDRIESWTGVKLTLFGTTTKPAARESMSRLLIGTADSTTDIDQMIGKNNSYVELNDQGYFLRATSDPDLVVIAGKTSVGTTYGIGELLNYRLEVDKANVWCEPFEVAEQPALPYRWFWLSTTITHWDARHGGPHMADESERNIGRHPDGEPISPGGYPGQFKGPDAYRDTYEAMIDWMSEHKLNGAMVFGLLQSYNGGVEAVRELAHHGRMNGVDIIAGVGTMGYWGTYYGGVTDLNLDTLIKLRPDLYIANDKGAKFLCSSMPEVQSYWRSSARWIARAVPELAGLYLENSDLVSCQCERCTAARALEENDTGCYWDMMASCLPYVEEGQAIHPDWKIVYATYTSFSPEGLKQGTDHQRPRFPKQFPPSAICQWTVTGMNESNWPEGLKAPAAHSVGLLHSPSIWGAPDGEDRWWAVPGSAHDDASRLVRFFCQRMASSGFEGLIVKGVVSRHSPGPLLTYLALGEFSFHPQRTMVEWETKRLSRLFGGQEQAATYLRLARDTSRDLAERQRMVAEAGAVAGDPTLCPRALPYWQDLEEELRYRIRLLETIEAGK